MGKYYLQQGFTLIEVLVSVIVLAVGLLGLAALQTTALRFNHDAQLRSIAVLQVNTMADRMRANKVGVTNGNYNALSGIPTSTPSCTSCNPSDIAQRDLYQWNSTNNQVLPGGTGTVTVNGNLHTITIMWDQDRTGATGTNCSGNTQVDLTCVRLSVEL